MSVTPCSVKNASTPSNKCEARARGEPTKTPSELIGRSNKARQRRGNSRTVHCTLSTSERSSEPSERITIPDITTDGVSVVPKLRPSIRIHRSLLTDGERHPSAKLEGRSSLLRSIDVLAEVRSAAQRHCRLALLVAEVL
jgi:hypothetical protein